MYGVCIRSLGFSGGTEVRKELSDINISLSLGNFFLGVGGHSGGYFGGELSGDISY